ncbi:COMPASS (Complex proteins associated with Set1p) component shg1 family protein [Brugia pahangi]
MLVTKVEQSEVRQVVDAFKSEGTFDKLRRKIFTSIAATDRYQRVALNAEEIVDDLLKTSASNLTKNNALDILRKKLFALNSTQYGIMITEGLDAGETLCSLLEEIGRYVDSFLGLTKKELLENVQSRQPVEDHEVCDMEIDSDSEQSPQTGSTKETPLSDIALPPTTYPNPNLSSTVSFPHAEHVPSVQNTISSYRSCNSTASTTYAESTNEIITAKSKSVLKHSEDGNIEASFTSYQAQKIVTKKFYSNARAVKNYHELCKSMQEAVASKQYMASAVQYRTRRRGKACNGDFVYY